MLRKLSAVLIVTALLVFAAGTFAFAQGKPDRAGFAAKGGELRAKLKEKFQNLPQWKQEAIKRVLAKAHEKVQAVRADEDLTREQKIAKIRAIREAARERIRRIVHAGRNRAK
jgi:hypothetical protein